MLNELHDCPPCVALLMLHVTKDRLPLATCSQQTEGAVIFFRAATLGQKRKYLHQQLIY